MWSIEDSVLVLVMYMIHLSHTTIIMSMAFSYKLPTTDVWQATMLELREDSGTALGKSNAGWRYVCWN